MRRSSSMNRVFRRSRPPAHRPIISGLAEGDRCPRPGCAGCVVPDQLSAWRCLNCGWIGWDRPVYRHERTPIMASDCDE